MPDNTYFINISIFVISLRDRYCNCHFINKEMRFGNPKRCISSNRALTSEAWNKRKHLFHSPILFLGFNK